MFSSYSTYTQDKREEIIFKPQFTIISNAIKEGKKIFITTKSIDYSKFEISPYGFARSKEEMHNYLLASSRNGASTFRLSRIVSVNKLTKKAEITEDHIETFKKLQQYGPQFNYKPRKEDIVVKLTKEGIRKIKLIYVHRPTPKKIEGNLYYYDCSTSQVINYFERFGEDAMIVSPVEIKNMVTNYYKRAYNVYVRDSIKEKKN